MIRFFRLRRERELDEEIRRHFEMAVSERIAAGESREDAERSVRQEFGNVERVKEETREAWGWRWADRRAQDVHFALRALRRNPAFALSALAILALGIGANTALFSVVNAVLLDTPSVVNPDRLVTVYTTCRAGAPRCSSSYPDYLDYRDRTTLLQDIAIDERVSVNLGSAGDSPVLADIATVSGNYFNLLGIRPHIGRLLQPSDDEVGVPALFAVLSHAAWSGRFAADLEIIGRRVTLNGTPFDVIGVAAEGFRGTTLTSAPEIFVPITAQGRLQTPPGAADYQARLSQLDTVLFGSRNVRWMRRLVGRLAPGATVDQAYQELLAVSEGLRDEEPDMRGPRSITVDPANHYALPEEVHDDLPRYLALLAGVVGLILVLACANIASLLLTRGAARQKEIAMRQALGADRERIVSQLVTESLVLGLLGGALGLILAPVFVRAFSGSMLPGGVDLAQLDLSLGLHSLLFAVVVSFITSVAFGLTPALRGGRENLHSLAKGATNQQFRGGHWVRKTLVGVQAGLCVLLLVGSGLFLQTVRNGLSYDSGFDPSNLALLQFSLQPLGVSPAGGLEGVRQIQERTTALPGVQSASIVTRAPLVPGGQGVFFEIPGYTPAADEELRLEWVGGTSGAFATLGISLDAGADIAGGSDRRVWINETMAGRYFPSGAIGNRVSMLDTEFTVAGIFSDTDWDRIGEQTINNAIVPLGAGSDRVMLTLVAAPLTLVVRLDEDGGPSLGTLQDAVRSTFPDVTFLQSRWADDVVRSQLGPQRLVATILSGLGTLALVLAGLGTAGVVAYLVNQRKRDIGIRIALGARPGRIVGMFVWEMTVPVLIGSLVGALATVVLGRTAESFLFGIAAGDARTIAVAVLVLSTVATAAVLLPARRISAIEPMVVLRDD